MFKNIFLHFKNQIIIALNVNKKKRKKKDDSAYAKFVNFVLFNCQIIINFNIYKNEREWLKMKLSV